jgi:uncharacterized protein (TIGR03437 family)
MTYPLPAITSLHGHNALSDNGTLVSHFLDASGLPLQNSVALTRPYEEQRLVFQGDKVGFAGISADGRFVFLREDRTDGESRLVEIDLSSNSERTIFKTQNDRFYFYISAGADRVLIRYYQALSVWHRETNTTTRIADSDDFIASAILSDDGGTVAYQKTNGALHRIGGPNWGRDTEIYPPTPNFLSLFGRAFHPGSAAFFNSRGFRRDTKFTINGLGAPILRVEETSVQGQELLLQVPWELTAEESQVELRASAHDSPFEFQMRQGFTTQASAAFYNYRDPGQPGFVVSAANEDFSSLISSQTPARSGELIHVYLGGLGRLDRAVKTGEAGPFDPPAKPLAALQCEIRNLDTNSAYRALEIPTLIYAPGLIGVYQADMRIPTDWPSGYNALRCRADGSATDESRIYTRRD